MFHEMPWPFETCECCGRIVVWTDARGNFEVFHEMLGPN
jgi:hypothetical protein